MKISEGAHTFVTPLNNQHLANTIKNIPSLDTIQPNMISDHPSSKETLITNNSISYFPRHFSPSQSTIPPTPKQATKLKPKKPEI